MGRFIKLNNDGKIEEVTSLKNHFGTSDIYSSDYDDKLYDYFNGIVVDFQGIIDTLNSRYKNNTTVGLENNEKFSIVNNNTGDPFMEVGLDSEGKLSMKFFDNVNAETIENLQTLNLDSLSIDKDLKSFKGTLGGFEISNNEIKTDINSLFKIESNHMEAGDLILANNLKVRGALICTLSENMTEGQEIQLGSMRIVKENGKIQIYFDTKVYAKENIYLYNEEEENKAVEKKEMDTLEEFCKTSIENLSRNLQDYFSTYNLPFVNVVFKDIEVNHKGNIEFNKERNITFFPDSNDSKIHIKFNRENKNILLHNFSLEIDKEVSDTESLFLKNLYFFNSTMDPASDDPGYVSETHHSGSIQKLIDHNSAFTLEDLISMIGADKKDGLLVLKAEFEAKRKNGTYLHFKIEFTEE